MTTVKFWSKVGEVTKWVTYCTALSTDDVPPVELVKLFIEVQCLRATGLEHDAHNRLAKFQSLILSGQARQIQTMECILDSSLDAESSSDDSEGDSGDESWELPGNESAKGSEDAMEVDPQYDNKGVSCALCAGCLAPCLCIGSLPVAPEFLARVFTSRGAAAWSRELRDKATLWKPVMESWAHTLQQVFSKVFPRVCACGGALTGSAVRQY